MGKFRKPITFENTGRRSSGRPVLRLTEPLHYFPGPGMAQITVPGGFETDCASVPRFFWRVAAPWDALEPAATHDWLYRRQSGHSRWLADRIFLLAMRDVGVPWWRRYLMWSAVRLFGRSAYHAR